MVEVVRQPAFLVVALVAAIGSAAAGVVVGVREAPAREAKSFTSHLPVVAGAVFHLRCPDAIPGSALRRTPHDCTSELLELDGR